jgi:DNA-binding GntR family transcriptional regulator
MERKKHQPNNGSVDRLQIAEILQAEVARGTLKPGQRLVESHLCERFGTKRSRIREVLRQLEQNGFVNIIPNVGATVASLSQKDIEQTYDLLGVLEGLAVRVITPFLTVSQSERLEDLLENMEVTDKPSSFLDYNLEFHSLLTSWSENDRLMKFTEILRRNQKRYATHSFLSPGQIQASRIDHRRIFNAMKAMKPVEAERLMRTHLLRAKHRLIKYMNKSL